MVAVNLGVAHYWLDHIYGAFMHRMRLAPPFFSGGWGGAKLELLEQMSRQLIAQGLAQVSLQHWPPPAINPVWRTVWESKRARLQEGVFTTPCEEMLRQVLPIESQTARVRLLSPRNVPAHETSCVVHLAGMLSALMLSTSLCLFFFKIRISKEVHFEASRVGCFCNGIMLVFERYG